MQSEASIRAAATELDDALEAGDQERVVACFAPDCTVELLGVRLDGHDGVRRWLHWVFSHVERIEFTPRLISVVGDTFVEEFGVTGILRDGRRLDSQWAEILAYRDNLVVSLRLYFNPVDFAPALGLVGRAVGPTARRLVRRGLAPFQPLSRPCFPEANSGSDAPHLIHTQRRYLNPGSRSPAGDVCRRQTRVQMLRI